MTRTLANGLLLGAVVAVLGSGCLHVKSDPVEVKPIKIDVTVTVKIDRELDNIFESIDKADPTMNPAASAPPSN